LKLRVPGNGGIHIVGQLKPVRVALGYPFGAGVTGFFHDSMLRLMEHELRKEHPLLSHRIPQSGLYIDHNRNDIVRKFMTTEADWLLQVDSDIQFPVTLIESLLKVAGDVSGPAGRRIVGASVPLGPPLPSTGWMMTDQPGIWAAVPAHQITEAGIECDGLATAIILIHRSVLDAIADMVGQCWFLKMMTPRLTSQKSLEAWRPEGRVSEREYVSVGEDLAFSMRALDAGFKSWVCKIPGLKHHKTLPLSHDFEIPPVGDEPKPVDMPLVGGPLPYESVVEV